MARFRVTKLPPDVPANTPDREVANHVERYFPEIRGPLRELWNRFRSTPSYNTENRQPDILTEGRVEADGECPCCGVKLEVVKTHSLGEAVKRAGLKEDTHGRGFA